MHKSAALLAFLLSPTRKKNPIYKEKVPTDLIWGGAAISGGRQKQRRNGTKEIMLYNKKQKRRARRKEMQLQGSRQLCLLKEWVSRFPSGGQGIQVDSVF